MIQRGLIYARYSTDLQSDNSIADQFALCEAYAARNSITVIGHHADHARSGASVIGRDGLMAIMDAAREGTFDVLIVEALDRISRDQEDLAGLFKRLQFAGIRIEAVHDGLADAVQIGIRGLVGTLFLQDLAKKVHRGLSGRVREGKSAGGRAYGYRPVPGSSGDLEIVDDEADTIRRIFNDYLDGKSARDIANALNREHVPAPRGNRWRSTTIHGNQQRGYGILHNALYDGRLVWNRVTMIKDPDTGRRISRTNPKSEWQETAADHLRIVDAETFAAVQQKSAPVPRGSRKKKPKRVLSGLIKCSACGGTMEIKDHSSGRTRIRCSTYRESKSCTNNRTYHLEAIEAAVIGGLAAKLQDREAIAHYVKTYNDERQRLAAGKQAAHNKAVTKETKLRQQIDRVTDLVIRDVISEDEAVRRLEPLRVAHAKAKAELKQSESPTNVVALQPSVVQRYLADLEKLRDIQSGAADLAPEAFGAIRDLIDRVEVQACNTGETVNLTVSGYLSALIDERLADKIKVSGGFIGSGRGT